MKRILQRFLQSLDLLAQPRYPEYEEYRDEDSDDARERPTREGSAAGPVETSPEARKLAQLKLMTVAILFFGSLALGYFWFVREAPAGRPGQPSPEMLRQALENEMRNGGVTDASGSAERNESLDEIKRWAAEMDERVQREAGLADSMPRSLPAYYGQGRTWSDSYALAPVEVILPVEPETAVPAGLPAPAFSSHSSPVPAAAPLSSPVPAVAPLSSPAPAVAPPPTASNSTETRGGYYRRREIAPVAIEPVNVEPY